MSGQQYQLWFGNQSSVGGQALVYQDVVNVAFSGSNLLQLAWLVVGANPGVWVRFGWNLSYGFQWQSQSGPARSYQVVAADPQSANRVVLSHDQNGFVFSTPTASSPSGSLLVAEDPTVPAAAATTTGIAMSGAGTFATPVAPNTTLSFTPTNAAQLVYRITFGSSTFAVGDVVTPSALNPGATVTFPVGVTAMTAVIDSQNTWTVTSGAPQLRLARVLDYRAGVGIVTPTTTTAAPEPTARSSR
jgi:hypothetical protein